MMFVPPGEVWTYDAHGKRTTKRALDLSWLTHAGAHIGAGG